jgi:hypothetical protein
MGDALFQSLQVVRRRTSRRRAIPPGYGLLLGVSISVGLWGLITWAVIKAFD